MHHPVSCLVPDPAKRMNGAYGYIGYLGVIGLSISVALQLLGVFWSNCLLNTHSYPLALFSNVSTLIQLYNIALHTIHVLWLTNCSSLYSKTVIVCFMYIMFDNKLLADATKPDVCPVALCSHMQALQSVISKQSCSSRRDVPMWLPHDVSGTSLPSEQQWVQEDQSATSTHSCRFQRVFNVVCPGVFSLSFSLEFSLHVLDTSSFAIYISEATH